MLWHEAPPAWAELAAGVLGLGLIADDDQPAQPGFPLLRRCRQPPAAAQQADAWMVPPGLGAHFPLIDSILDRNGPVLVAVDGLGSHGIASLRAKVGKRLVLAFDLRPLDLFAIAEQLAWLAAQPEPFAVYVNGDRQAVMAVLAGAATLIVPAEVKLDPQALLRVMAARQPGGARPLSLFELDGLDGKEACLTVRRPLAPGAILTAEDLDVTVSDNLGLSPHLAERVAGLRLRYPIAPGEPLHFAHFEDPSP